MNNIEIEIVDDILESEQFDIQVLDKLDPFNDMSDWSRIIANILYKQYCLDDLRHLYVENDFDEVIGFVNALFKLHAEHGDWLYSNDEDDIYHLSNDELERFRTLAERAENVPKTEMAKADFVLTTWEYLCMCRVIYTNTTVRKYPEDTSVVYMYCTARGELPRENAIFWIDEDDPEAFANDFRCIYHNEELWFGGPKLYINDLSRKGIYYDWIGDVVCDCNASRKNLYRAIKMYTALRENGYPVYCHNYNELLSGWKKYDP